MMEIRTASLEDADRIREIFVEYLTWADDENAKRWGRMVSDFDAFIEHDIAGLSQYMPPDGRFLMALDGDQVMGCTCLKRLGEGLGEIKRMYVRPAYRRQGVARALVERLLEDAEAIGYHTVRLDSSNFMTAAHALYREMGFVECEPYAGSQIPDYLQPYWVFMERRAGG